MTDRLKGFIVTLSEDIREDDAEHLRQAILMLKGIIDVRGSVRTVDDVINRARIRMDLSRKLVDVLKEDP